MVMDTEFWTSVINGGANLVIAGAMVVQTLIFFITFKFGFKYLDQHRSKIRLEKNAELSEKIIGGLNEMTGLIEAYFKGIDVYTLNDFIKDNSPFDVPNEFVNIYAKLLIINRNVESLTDEINLLYSQIELWVAFLKDYEARVLLRKVKFIHIEIIDELDSIFSKIKEESDTFISEFTPEERNEYVKKKKKEYQDLAPKSFFNSNIQAFQDYRFKLYDIKEYIIEHHIP